MYRGGREEILKLRAQDKGTGRRRAPLARSS